MATAKKLPSGNWRVQVYSHTNEQGRKVYESFTASTKQEAEMKAAKFANDNDRRRSEDLTVSECLNSYFEANRLSLSPATLDGYMKDAKRCEYIKNVRIRKITSKDVQSLITYLTEKGYAPKTIKNTIGTLKVALVFSGVDQTFKLKLPSAAKKTKVVPETEQVKMLYEIASRKMKIVIALAAFHSLRRGEIAAIKYGDITNNRLIIHADIVYGADKKWHYKEVPKTDASNRILYLSDQLLALIGTGDPEDFIYPVMPNTIGENFIRLKKRVGLMNEFTLHDLRHYFATLAQILGVPDTYTANLGGWRNNSSVLKEVYQGNMVSMSETYAKRINEKYSELTDDITRNSITRNCITRNITRVKKEA